MNVIMRATLGDGWEQLFDLRLGACRKPLFFRRTDCPFYSVDTSKKNFKGVEIVDGANLNSDEAFLEGNANAVH